LLGKRSKLGKIREYETHRSESTEARDRGVKFEDYAVHGVGEYWIIDTESETVEQYLPGPDGYELKVKAATGTITSEVIAGLSLPVRAIFDKVENLAALRLLM
jgi:Uma2 family endonuclease